MIAAGSIAALDILTKSTELRDTLESNTRFFRDEMSQLGFNVVPGTHPICPVMFGDAALASSVADEMLKKGVYVIGFSYPVVPMGKARIRTQVSAAHSHEDLDFAVRSFAAVAKELRLPLKH